MKTQSRELFGYGRSYSKRKKRRRRMLKTIFVEKRKRYSFRRKKLGANLSFPQTKSFSTASKIFFNII
jgi:hypothetical protein